jgi:hypothetical protein
LLLAVGWLSGNTFGNLSGHALNRCSCHGRASFDRFAAGKAGASCIEMLLRPGALGHDDGHR